MFDLANRPSILIVDDSPEILDALKAALIDEYMVRPAINGQVALRLAALDPQPELILLDVLMPGMDGHEVCRKLKMDMRTRDIPVIFVTAMVGDKDELIGLQLGAVDYITKPISPPIVKARVRTHLALRRTNLAIEEKNRRLYEINERLTDSMQQLSASEERFRGLVQTIPDIVYKIDEEGRFTFLNRSIERLGYHQADLIGRHFSEIIHSADIQDASLKEVLDKNGPGSLNPNQKVFDERRTGLRMTIGLEIRLKSKSGATDKVYELKNIDQQVVHVEVNSTGLYGEIGQETTHCTRQYIGTVGVIRDISDRMKIQTAFMEERKLLRQLIDTIPLPIFFVDANYHLTFSNTAFQRFFGLDSGLAEGLYFPKIFVADDYREMGHLLSGLFEKRDHGQVRQEIVLRTKNHEPHSFNVILVRYQKDADAEAAIIGVLVDITEQRATNLRLVEAKRYAEAMAETAEQASRAKGSFLANMSHEIRTPLNAVIGLTHLCLQTTVTDKQRDYLNKVHLSANSLLSLLNDILDFAKIEAGKLSIEHSPFSLDAVLDSLVAIFGHKCQDKGLELLVQVRPNVPSQLKGDAHRLGQILINLVGNAVKFTEQGEVSITVSLAEENKDQVLLCFSVQDTGTGMTAEQMGKLFQEFCQGDASITRRYGGSGLGLTICKRLIQLMGGYIDVDSRPGRGSCFNFTAYFNQAGEGSTPPRSPTEDLRTLKILVVDDNPHARQILAETLKTLSYQPVCVADGEKAIEAVLTADANGVSFDLVFMDWRMPGMNGLETTRRIKATVSLSKIPVVIMVSAYGREDIMTTTDPSPLDGWLMKPVRRNSLLDAIMAAFGCTPEAQQMYSPEQQLSALAGSKILLAEDNEINQQVARELLENIGIKVTVVNNGQEAVTRVAQEDFDAILMDLQMPVMDGLSAVREIRRTKSCEILPIIAMTANALVGDREKCLEAQMNDHVVKPVAPKELYETLVKWMRVRSGGAYLQYAPPLANYRHDQTLVVPLLPGIDSARGLRNVGGNSVLYRDILLKFSRTQGGTCQEMARCIATDDSSALGDIAHALKGGAATIGAVKLADLAERIEISVGNPESLRYLPEYVSDATTALSPLLSAIGIALGAGVSAIPEKVAPAIDSTPEELTPLFVKAVDLLVSFDVSVEKVVLELSTKVASIQRIERLNAIRSAIGAYDFETCLSLFHEWAEAERIPIQ